MCFGILFRKMNGTGYCSRRTHGFLRLLVGTGIHFYFRKKEIAAMRYFNWAVCVSACVVASVLFGACDSSLDGTKTFTVGVVQSLTGTLGIAGEEGVRGMNLAVDEMNDSGVLGNTMLEFTVVDTRSDFDMAIEAYNDFTDMGVNVIFLPLTSTITKGMVDASTPGEAVIFSPTSSASGLGASSSWLFRTALTLDRMVPAGIEISKRSLGYNNVALIVNSMDVFSRSSHDEVIAALQNHTDVTIVSNQSFERDQGEDAPDLTAQLTDIMNSNPDAIFVSGLPEDHFGVLTQAHILGISGIPYLIPLFAIVDAQRINDAAAGAAEGAVTFQVWLSDSDHNTSQQFVSNYMARYNAVPGDFAARSFAGVQILTEALRVADNYQTASIRDALAGIRNHDTIYGSFSFDSNGDAVYEPIVAQVTNNEFVPLGN